MSVTVTLPPSSPRRVIRMGKIIAPEQAPFSGPRAVENPTQAS